MIYYDMGLYLMIKSNHSTNVSKLTLKAENQGLLKA